MGLLDRLRGISDPIDGEYRLVACSANTGGAVYENCSMDGVVTGPGVPPTPVHHTALTAPTAKWPFPGQVLPVTFDRAHPDRLKIRWDDIPTARQTAADMSRQLAAQMAAAPPPPPTPDGRPVPGRPGGGLTPQETAAALAGGAAALGLVATTARVTSAHLVDATVGPGGTWDLRLDVSPTASAPGYATVLRIGFSSPERRDTIAAIGRLLPVLADPTRPDRIAVDPSRL